jgi:subtilase family serine protease
VIRRMSLVLLAIAAIVSAGSIDGQAQSLLTRHVPEVIRNGQTRSLGRLPATQVIQLVIVLPLRDQAGLDAFLHDLYDPASSSYRQFLTVPEFTERFGPSQENYDAVIRFAEANGLAVVGTSRNRMNVEIKGGVENIEKAFHLTMGVYQHPTENRTFYSPDREPTVDLPFPLWHISGLDNYSIPHPAGLHKNPNPGVRSNATTGSGPSSSFLGSDMRAAYYGATALTGSGQSLGLLEYYGTDLSDLDTYFKNAGETNNVPITLLSTDGTSTSCLESKGCDDTEQTLDMTQAIGMAPGLSSLVMYVGSTDSAIFNAMATASPLNAELSSSWTWSPADPSTDNPYFEEFAAQGQNLFQAAGDSDKWTSSSEIFPADDVYLTSVGGTDLETSGAAGPWSSETAWADGGGGISPDKFAIPSWQTTAASGCSSCSKTYRNGPDVSANANFTFYVCADQTTCTANEYGGTSFATPMWAGYLALVNQQAVANGNKTLGFINPSLYTLGEGSSYDSDFHDITSGSNGYSATTGYDLATGWGSPNGTGLIDALAPTATSPAFTISASPASVSVVQGNNGTSTITTTVSGGFDSAVALSASGQPTGVTVSFSPASIAAPGSGTSEMLLSVARTAKTGTYPITITGTGGGITHTTTLTFEVTRR